MDAQQQLAWNCEDSVVVLGKGKEFLLVPLGEAIPASLQFANVCGYTYCGVIGYPRIPSTGSRP